MSDKPAYDSPEEARQALRDSEGFPSKENGGPETVKKQCTRWYVDVSQCRLIPYEKKDGRIGWVGIGCREKCKFP